MLRKVFKGLTFFALMLFSVGILSLVPTINNSKVEDNTSASEVATTGNTLSTEQNDTWINQLDSVNKLELTAIEGKADGTLQERLSDAGYEVYIISEAKQLAEVAYSVNKGDFNDSMQVFFLTADIDLSSAFWTPIGTSTHPFNGIFFGNGHTISNIIINDYSAATSTKDGLGLFGNNCGVVYDLKIGGNNYIYSSNPSKVRGVIVGYNNNGNYENEGFVVNCDLAGTINDELDIIAEGLHTFIYNLNINKTGGVFKRGNSKWYEDGVVKITNNSDLTVKCDYFQPTGNIKLRENADEGNVYPIYEGSQAVIPSSISTNSNLGWNDNLTKTVILDYGYGTRGTNEINRINVNFKYDQTFESWFITNSKFKTRAGYNFAGIYNSNTTSKVKYNDTGADFQKAYPYYKGNAGEGKVYFEWTTTSDRAYTVKPIIASDEGGMFTDVSSALNGEITVVSNGEKGTLNETTKETPVNNVTSGSSTFTITLDNAYEIDTTNIKYGNDAEVTTRSSGLYFNFSNHTGLGSSYNSSQNNDDYNLVNGSITKSGNTYTITVDNIVGKDGQVLLVIKRKDVKIELTTDIVDEGNVEKGIPVYDSVNKKVVVSGTYGYEIRVEEDTTIPNYSKFNYLKVEGGIVYLITKKGENPKLVYNTHEISDLVILNQNITGNNDTDNITLNELETSNQSTYEYFKTWKRTIGTNSIEGRLDHSINTVLGTIKSRVEIQTYYRNTQNGDSEYTRIDKAEGNFNGISLSINGSNGVFSSEGMFISLRTVTKEEGSDNIVITNDSIEVTSNGYYYASKFKINDGDFISFNNNNNYNYSIKNSELYFTEAFSNEGNNYIIKIYLDQRQYEVNYEIHLGENKDESNKFIDYKNDINLFVIDDTSIYTDPTRTIKKKFYPGESGTITVTLSDTAKGILYFNNGASIGNSTGSEEAGKRLNALSISESPFNNGIATITYTIGTYEGDITIHFEYKNIIVTVNGLYDIDDSLEKYSEDPQNADYISKVKQNRFNYSAEKGVFFTDTDFGSIDIHSKYYLVGWYLKGDKLYNTDNNNQITYGSILLNSNIIADMVKSSAREINSPSVVYTNVLAGVRQRTITVNYYSNRFDETVIYEYDDPNSEAQNFKVKNAGTLTFGSSITLNHNQFSKLGYTFSDWNVLYGEVLNSLSSLYSDKVTTSDTTFAINESNWYTVFGVGSNGRKTWDNFNIEDRDEFEAVGQYANRNVYLRANWNIITYTILIDNRNAQNHENEVGFGNTINIQLGQSIEFNNNNRNKNGQARYTIDAISSAGSSLNGYIAIGFAIQHGAFNKDILTNGITSYTFDVENAKTLLNKDYYFKSNSGNDDSKIEIRTVREKATYTVTIFASDYYSVGSDENIVLTATYDTLLGNVLTTAITDAMSRSGYTHGGYLRVNSLGQKISNNVDGGDWIIDPNEDYTITEDIFIVPVWEKASKTAQSIINYTEDAKGRDTFYLFKEHDFIIASLDGNNPNEDKTLIPNYNTLLTNGDIIKNVYFKLSYNDTSVNVTASKNSQGQYLLNLNKFNLPTVYTVTFIIELDDGLIKKVGDDNTYSVVSNELTFTMLQNEIFFIGYNLYSIYNGTNEFVSTTEVTGNEYPKTLNNFGKFSYKYDWNARELTKIEDAIDDNENYFITSRESSLKPTIEGNNFNVGKTKSLRLYLNTNSFNNDIGDNYNELFSNVNKDSKGYYVIIRNDLEIVKAKYTIYFTPGSTYYIPNVTVIVDPNTNKTTNTFNIGSQTFKYTYDRIELPASAKVEDEDFVLYQGAKDHSVDENNFVIKNLKIENHEEDLETNFEWNISLDSSFKLVNSNSAVKLNYQTRYLIARNGNIVENLGVNYLDPDDQFEHLFISNIRINGNTITIPDREQDSYTINNEIIFSYVNNHSKDLIIYVNPENASSLEFDVVIELTAEREQTLTVLSWGTSNNPNDYKELFENNFTARSSYDVAVGNDSILTYAILTDVVKLDIDYNGGYSNDEEKRTSESYFLSASHTAWQVNNPVHDYAGLEFNGYSDFRTSNIKSTIINEIDGKIAFTVIKGGRKEEIKAKWNFNSIVERQIENSFEDYANVSGLTLGVTDVAEISYPDKTIDTRYTLSNNSLSFEFNKDTLTFAFKNEVGMAVTSMTGDYTLSVIIIYNDGVQGPQTQKVDYIIHYTVNINKVGIERDTLKTLKFNNQNQISNVDIKTRLNGVEKSEFENGVDLKLSHLPQTLRSEYCDYDGYGFYVSILSATKKLREINLVDSYQISVMIDPKLSEVYEIESNSTNNYGVAYIVIEKYDIILKNVQNQINLSKQFGMEDPLLEATIEIEENANDEVALRFTRSKDEGCEAIGEHILTFSEIILQADKDNYTVNTQGFDRKFTITLPEARLKIDLEEKLTYTYNGYLLEDLTVTYNGTNYTLTGVAGKGSDFEKVVSTKFDLYYLSGSARVEIPDDQKSVYAGYIVFSSENTRNVGEYSYSVALSGTQIGDWKGVDITNSDKAYINVEKRVITVTDITKTFDQTNSYLYNNTVSTDNTVTSVTIENIVSIDGKFEEIQISGKFLTSNAGYQDITEFNLDEVGIFANYTLEKAKDLQVLVLPSKEDVDVNITTTNSKEIHLNYGSISDKTTISQMLNNSLVPLSFKGEIVGNIEGKYINIPSFAINNGVYSTGKYLTVKYNDKNEIVGWDVIFNVTSTNYTFGAEVQEVGKVYNTSYTLSIVIDKIELNLTNTSLVITKVYDGFSNVLESFTKQNVNAGGYYSAVELLPNDIITIDSASYSDREVGNNKVITANLSKDYLNYDITQKLKGNITDVPLIFKKNGATISFVDGVKTFGNSDNLIYEYDSNLENLINAILNEETFLTRVGYHQTGWTYVIGGSSVDVSKMNDSEKARLLQDAVEGKENGITLNAIWEINRYTLVINGGEQAKVTLDDKDPTSSVEVEFNYYDSFEVSVKVNPGYTYENVTLSNSVAEFTTVEGLSTRNAKFTLNHVVDNLTASVDVEEITVKITIDYNNPEDFGVSTNSENWTSGIKERVVSFSEMRAKDLPSLFVTTENTYNFKIWQMENKGSFVDSNETTIWERISGKDLLRDDLTGYRFKAIWIEAPLTITINNENSIITLTKLDKENGNEQVLEDRELEDGVYDIHFNDTIKVSVNSSDWWKWTGLNINGSYTSITGNTTPNNNTNGEFTLNVIRGSLTLDIITTPITVNFTSLYETPVGSSVLEAIGSKSGNYSVDQTSKTKISDVIEIYTTTKGTYDQDYWLNGENVANFDEEIKSAIIKLYGKLPTQDISISLKAHFQGKGWTLTFIKDNGNAYFDNVEGGGAGSESSLLQVITHFTYGEAMINIPSLTNSTGQGYVWESSNGETYQEGSVLTTKLIPSENQTLTLTANWVTIKYNLTLNFTGITNQNKIKSVSVDGENYVSEQVIDNISWGTNRTFIFDMEEGYELDSVNTSKVDFDGEEGGQSYEGPTLTFTSNTLTVSGIKRSSTIYIKVKAKDYKINITSSKYEEIKVSEFDISYDKAISSLNLNIDNFKREGYILDKLVTLDGEEFVKYDAGLFTFGNTFVKGSLYKYDGNLTLKAVWKSEKTYFNAQIEVFSDKYFNGQKQKIADATITTINNEEIVKGTTFDNGDKIVDIYYELDGKRVDCESDFSLLYRNVILSKDLLLKIDIQDTLTEDTITYTCSSNTLNVSLLASPIVIDGANLESYYSGTKTFYPTSNNDYGTLKYQDNTVISEVSIDRVEIIDNDNQFNVKDGYSVRYYFNVSGEFNENNYSGITQEGSYYTMLASDKASVVKTPITITLSGIAYENGKKQEIKDFTITKPDYVKDFVVTINSLMTSDTQADVYTNDFELDWIITNSGERTTNFTPVYEGNYEIVTSEKAYKVDASVKYFDSEKVVDKNDINITINYAVYNSERVEISGSEFNYVKDDVLIFSISANGSNKPLIQVTNTYEVSFNISVDGDMALLSWERDIDLDALTFKLNALTSEGSKNTNIDVSAQSEIYAILTDYKAIFVNNGDCSGDQGYVYIKLGSSKEVLNSAEWTGFIFDSFVSDNLYVTISGNTVTVDARAKITYSTITAIWNIENAQGSVNNITRSAKIGLDDNIDAINLTDVLGENGITNRNNQALKYTFEWYQGDNKVFEGEEGFVLPANFTSSGAYTLRVVVSKEGYTSTTTNFDFTLTITKLTIESVTFSGVNFEYGNSDFANTIQVTFQGAGLGTQTLKDLLNKQEEKSYYFTMTGKDSARLKDVGSYTLTLGLDTRIFDNFTFTENITITKANVTVSLADIPEILRSKYFGENDPEFKFTKEITSNSENITVILERESGENVASYKFINANSPQEGNYNITISNDAIFEILKSPYALNITLDNDLTYVYNKQKPTIDLEFNDEKGQWEAKIGDSISKISLSYTNNADNNIVGDLYKIALNNVTLSLDKVNAGIYNQEFIVVGAKGETNFINFEFNGSVEITKRPITITNITKVFDRNSVINDFTTVTIENLITGDDVKVKGIFETNLVGNGIKFVNLDIEGKDVANYNLTNKDFAQGVITPLNVTNISVDVSKKSFVYGELSQNTSIDKLQELVNGVSLSLDEVTSDLENNFVKVSNFAVQERYLSSSKNFKVGSVVIRLFFTSNNITGFEPQGYEVTLNVAPKVLDLSGMMISKNYDKTKDMPKSFNTSLEGYILEGDFVSLNKEQSKYETSEIGSHIKVNLVKEGADKDNYSILDNVFGVISEYNIRFNVIANEENLNLVTDGNFVEDGESVLVKESLFAFKYPAVLSADEIIAKMTLPTRKGYTAKGWKYLKNSDYVLINSSNILQLLEDIAFDETNEEAVIDIFTVWEIDEYKVEVNGQNLADYSVSGDYVTLTGGVYKARYFTNLTISVVGERGYKVNSYNIANGDSKDSDLSDLNKTTGSAILYNIGSNIVFNVEFSEIKIEFNFDVNTPEYTNRVDRLNTVYSYNYITDLSNLTKDELAKFRVTDGTYYLSGYTYNYQEEDVEINNEKLKDIVDKLYPDLDRDSIVTLKAKWTGEDYILKFDPNGGKLIGAESILATFGSEIKALPVAEQVGRSFVWKSEDGKVYEVGSILNSVGTFINENYTIELVAEWTNNPYNLTITLGDNIKARVNGSYVTSGSVYTIIFSEEALNISVEPSEGYSFVTNSDGINGDVSVNGNMIAVANLIENGEIIINSTPSENTLNIFTNKVSSHFINDEEFKVSSNKVIALTESEVVITFIAVKGYGFEDNSFVLTGSGKILLDYSEDKRSVTLTWKDFTNNATLQVTAKPAENKVTIGDVSDIFDSLTTSGGRSINLQGDILTIKTEETLVLNGFVKYGYKDAIMSCETAGLIKSQSNTWSDRDKLYYFTATIEGFEENFTLTFTVSKRTYDFTLSLKEGENFGQINSSLNQTALFGESIILNQTTLDDSYVFAGWEMGGQIISLEEAGELQISKEIMTSLEKFAHGEEITIYATYKVKKTIMTFASGNRGQYDFYQEDEKTTVLGNQSVTREVNIGTLLYIELKADEGYELDKLYLDDKEVNDYEFDKESQIITIYLNVDNIAQNLRITFKASDVNIYVQASILLNYEINRGTTAGGSVYISDERGNRLDDSYYLPVNDTLVMYGDFRMISKTDESVYFTATPRSGFEVTFNCYTSGVILSEYTVGTNKVYCFSGVKEGTRIEAIFSAKSNNVEIILAVEGEEEVSVAGKIQVDTSSSMVNASNNNSQNVNVSAITGQNLNLTISTNFAYELAKDENGRVKYKFVAKGESEGFKARAGEIEELDLLKTTFTNRATLDFTNVDSDGVIYIYVIPHSYNLSFYIDENDVVTIENALMYEKAFSISPLSEQDREKVFRQREGFTLGGYYTKQIGQGNQYIDGNGNVLDVWRERVYVQGALGYEYDKNFNPQTNTFMLYPAWIYNKSTITIDFTPDGFTDEYKAVGITDVITNIDRNTSWLSQDNRWFAQVIAGLNLKLQAYEYEGYEFMHWLVSVDDGAPVQKGSTFSMVFTQGDYIIKAIYQPKFNLSVENLNNDRKDGGQTNLIQNGKVVIGTSYDSQLSVTLEALANEGYKFLYWEDVNSGEKIYPENGTNRYTFEEINKPLNLKAVFEGKKVAVTLDSEELENYHEIVGVKINGEEVDYTQEFDSRVGDEITIEVIKNFGFGFDFQGANFVQSINSEGHYVYSYIFNVNDLEKVSEEEYSIDIVCKVLREEIDIKVISILQNSDIEGENRIAGSITMVDDKGNRVNMMTNNVYKMLYGDTAFLYIKESDMYRLEAVYVRSDYDYNIRHLYDGEKIVINQNFITQYFEYEVQIFVEFKRLTWLDSGFPAESLVSEGTKESPYLISTPRDMAFVSYAVNSGLEREDGVKYADCYYKVTADLDFQGRYWIPIGTQNNPFNGVMDLGSYSIKNIFHYTTYSNPRTTGNGLFWHVTKNAKIIQSNNTLVIVFSVIGSIIFLILLIILIILLLRRKRRKEIDDLAQ